MRTVLKFGRFGLVAGVFTVAGKFLYDFLKRETNG